MNVEEGRKLSSVLLLVQFNLLIGERRGLVRSLREERGALT
jgi:hypothetical protein